MFTTLGVMLLWVGWFGFNAGSTIAAGDGSFFGFIAINTQLGAAAGAVAALLIANGFFATPELAAKVGVGKAGLFYGGGFEQLGVQALGVVVCAAFTFAISYLVLYLMKITIGIRVTEEEETIGLDLSEHGAYGYPEQMKELSHTSSQGHSA